MFDVIIIGGGASGLFAAANFNNKINGLILNKSKTPGMKLLMSGAGQCNMTKSGDIKTFLTHYGNNGNKIRKPLYKFNNKDLVGFFKTHGLPTVEREDGKIFPLSMSSSDVLALLTKKASENGFYIKNNEAVTDIQKIALGYTVTTTKGVVYHCLHLIIATGGLSYPVTGSDGSLFPVLSKLDVDIIPLKPALVPLFVEDYHFSSLSGISFPEAVVTLQEHSYGGGLLFTHKNFSGPAILDASRYAKSGNSLCINYLPSINSDHFLRDLKAIMTGSQKQISTVISECLTTQSQSLPKRFLDLLCTDSGFDPTTKASTLSGKQLKTIVEKLFQDSYHISGTAGFTLAMASAGGVSLEEMDLNSFECKKYPHLYIIGEALDVDGDTGGYNIQFAFTSGYLAAKAIASCLD